MDFTTGAPVRGDLDVRWIHGGNRSDPVFQVHAYDPHTYILRQSKAASAEAPFLYLLFGNERAILFDTGAGKQNGIRAVVDALVEDWLAAHPRPSYSLTVAHSHGHNDHVAGDAEFADRPDTVVVDRELAAVQEFFGFTAWPEEIVPFDLGGRVLEITGTPGHHRAAVAVFDPWSGFLLTGDTVLPGRLYAFDYPEFLASLDRMVTLTQNRPVTHVMGCHVEMTSRPGRDYPLGSRYQPDEPPPQLTVAQLVAVRDAAVAVADKPGRHAFADFLIMNGPYRGYLPRLMSRALLAKVWPPARR